MPALGWTFTVRHVQRQLGGDLKAKEVAEAAVQHFCDLGYGRPLPPTPSGPKGGRPRAARYEIHPDLQEPPRTAQGHRGVPDETDETQGPSQGSVGSVVGGSVCADTEEVENVPNTTEGHRASHDETEETMEGQDKVRDTVRTAQEHRGVHYETDRTSGGEEAKDSDTSSKGATSRGAWHPSAGGSGSASAGEPAAPSQGTAPRYVEPSPEPGIDGAVRGVPGDDSGPHPVLAKLAGGSPRRSELPLRPSAGRSDRPCLGLRGL